jgi:exonuclease V gamma subunit
LKDVLSTTDKPENLIRQRLNARGLRSDGTKIVTKKARKYGKGVYTPYTIFLKKQKGQEYRHVTLKDTGEFQKSFEKKFIKDALNIKANSQKEDGDISETVDLTNVLNLSGNEITELVKEIKPDFIKETRKAIGV